MQAVRKRGAVLAYAARELQDKRDIVFAAVSTAALPGSMCSLVCSICSCHFQAAVSELQTVRAPFQWQKRYYDSLPRITILLLLLSSAPWVHHPQSTARAGGALRTAVPWSLPRRSCETTRPGRMQAPALHLRCTCASVCLSASPRGCEEIALAAVCHQGRALRFASERLRCDRASRLRSGTSLFRL